MMINRIFLIFIWLMAACMGDFIPRRDYEKKQYFIAEIDIEKDSRPLHGFIEKYRDIFEFEHQVEGLENHFVFSMEKGHRYNDFLGNHNSNNGNLMKRALGLEEEYEQLTQNSSMRSLTMLKPRRLQKRMPVPIRVDSEANRLSKKDLNIVDSSQMPLKEASDKLEIKDPMFVEQWHLINTAYTGHDVNVTGLWYEGITGKGVVTAIVDDGLDYETEDLRENFNASGSWDFNDNTNLPKPRLSDDYHGTRCAGEIAAVRNDVCGVGVAYGSQVSGIRILSGSITASEEAASLLYGLEVNDIYSCSWGPADDGKTVGEPEMVVKKAILKGVQKGRQGKGAIYVFASGNGGYSGDSCNFDGYTNSIYSITIGAIDHKGFHPTYSEACSAVMAVTYSSGSGEHIHTTNINKQCTALHGGTSAAAPIAAGIYALVLEVNPNLTWRDMQHITVLSSIPVNENDGDYQTTALGRKFSDRYGYGKLDAYGLAGLAKNWQNVKPQSWFFSDVQSAKTSMSSEDAQKGETIKKVITVSKNDLEVSNLEKVEHVTVSVNIEASRRGSLRVKLISPIGMVSDLAKYRRRDYSSSGLSGWTFLSVAHWGESGEGDWTLEVFSENGERIDISLNEWQLKLFGESIDASKAEDFDLTKDYAAERRGKQKEQDAKNIGVQDPHVSSNSQKQSAVPTPEPNITSSASLKSSVASSIANIATSSKPFVTQPPKEAEMTISQLLRATFSTSSSPASSSIPPNSDGEGSNKHYLNDYTGHYFLVIAAFGFVIVFFLMKFHMSSNRTRRRRRENYEFDIIPGEDSDSEGEGEDDTMDLGTPNNASQNPRNLRDSQDVRDRLFDDLNADSLPEYDSDTFKIGDEDEDTRAEGVPPDSAPENSFSDFKETDVNPREIKDVNDPPASQSEESQFPHGNTRADTDA